MAKKLDLSGKKRSAATFSEQLEVELPALRKQARRLCGNDTLADDLVQSACLKAWESQAGFRASEPLGPWLGRILRNEFFQYCRRAWRLVDVDSDTLSEALTAPANQEASSDVRRLARAIFALPEGQCDAVILVLVLGMTYAETGKVLDCSEGTVKSRVNRARLWLQEGADGQWPQLGELAGEGGGLEGLMRHAEHLLSAA